MNVLKARESKCNLISWYHMYCTISPTESASFCLIFCFYMSACSQRNSFYFICCACHTSVCTKHKSMPILQVMAHTFSTFNFLLPNYRTFSEVEASALEEYCLSRATFIAFFQPLLLLHTN